jgi:hypothetical protein
MLRKNRKLLHTTKNIRPRKKIRRYIDLKKRQRKKRIILFSVALIIFFYWMFFSPVWQIKHIQINCPDFLPSAEIKNIISSQLNQKKFFIKNNNIFWADLPKIERILKKEFPSIGEVKFKRIFFNTVLVNVRGRVAQSLWCFLDPEQQTDSLEQIVTQNNSPANCFLADEQRIIFAIAQKEDWQQNKIIVLSEQPKKEIFQNVCAADLMTRMQETKQLLSEKFNLHNSYFVEKKNGLLIARVIECEQANEFNTNISGAKNCFFAVKQKVWEIYFNPANDLSLDLTKLRLLLEKVISSEQRKNLQYIDLRFQKAYYK